MNNADMPAMPQSVSRSDDGSVISSSDFAYCEGFSKREEMASRNMAAILANENYEAPRRQRLAGMAKDAVAAADALLAELEQPQ